MGERKFNKSCREQKSAPHPSWPLPNSQLKSPKALSASPREVKNASLYYKVDAKHWGCHGKHWVINNWKVWKTESLLLNFIFNPHSKQKYHDRLYFAFQGVLLVIFLKKICLNMNDKYIKMCEAPNLFPHIFAPRKVCELQKHTQNEAMEHP